MEYEAHIDLKISSESPSSLFPLILPLFEGSVPPAFVVSAQWRTPQLWDM